MSADGYVIGLDIGTTAVKAVAFGLDGRQMATKRVGYCWCSTQHGIELDADNLAYQATLALQTVLSELPPGPVRGVGFASLAESSVILDAAARPLAPVIAWHDKRDTEQLHDLDLAIGADTFSRTTGLPFRQQWSLTKYRWMHDHGAALTGVAPSSERR